MTSQDFPFLPALPGTSLVASEVVGQPLEVKLATADDEAMIAGVSHIRQTYDHPNHFTPVVFLSAYRDALIAAGWRILDVTKLEETPIQPETVFLAAHFTGNGRNVYARLSLEPAGPCRINIADVGAEDWPAMLTRDCRIRVHSIHFDLDRATFKPEAIPTLEQATAVLRSVTRVSVEIQGHSDNVGPEGDAQRQLLSLARAKAVASWLTAHGVPANRVTARGYGKTRPIVDNDSDLGRALNRRIEIVNPACGKQDG